LKLLFDHNVDRRFRRYLPDHETKTAREMGWDALSNGDLLAAAAATTFDAVLSLDKNLRHGQNLRKLPIPIIVVDSVSNALPALIPFAPYIQDLLRAAPLPAVVHVVGSDGRILRFGVP
jgi:hypothetical protein